MSRMTPSVCPFGGTNSPPTLWAKASKEWVVPAKPKPGRKPKQVSKDDEHDDAEESQDPSSRRGQNRAAQRAFRERKQNQLAELQERLRQYEKGEIERNVALQKISKKLKDDNERLLQENLLLKDQVASLTAERQELVAEVNRKRTTEQSADAQLSLTVDPYARKKQRVSVTDCSTNAKPLSASVDIPLLAHNMPSPDSNRTSLRASYSPEPHRMTDHRPCTTYDSVPALSTTTSMTKPFDDVVPSLSTVFGDLGCGLCSDNTHCVCRELGLRQSTLDSTSDASMMASSSTGAQPHTVKVIPSILDNLPAYQAPVPLRRRSSGRPRSIIFPVYPMATNTIATCSGDPSNCGACADDAFGQAFCSAIQDSASVSWSCKGCYGSNRTGFGRPGRTSGRCNTDHIEQNVPAPPSAPQEETIPCDNAWKQLKQHPNVGFADLRMLADVVARRPKCSGPQVVSRYTAEPYATEHALTPAEGQSAQQTSNNGGELPSSETRDVASSIDPEHSGSDVSLQCGLRPVRFVRYDAVRDALRMLDATYPSNRNQSD